jgi:hypothetical protein
MAVQVAGALLEKAGMKDEDAFLKVFIDAYLKETGNRLDNSSMPKLNGWQHSLLAYHYFREEVLQGGFVQLIQNGFGSYIFRNPFAKVLRIFGAEELSKIVYKAREIYDANQKELERETTEEEFHAMYEQFEAFDELEERFFNIEEDCTIAIARYVDAHLEEFAEILP